MIRVNRILICASMLAGLVGCAEPGANLKANVYQAGQVNQAQEAKVVDILAVLPAKIEADNSQNQQTAQVAGALLGAVGGAFLGGGLGNHHYSAGNFAAGGLLGGVAGHAAGSLVPQTALVEGVSLTYTENGHTLNSAQVGKMCEFAPGRAIVISTGPGETRIQPNASCPAASASR